MAKKSAFGSKLAIQVAQSGSYTDLANLKDISGPEISRETIDVTGHNSADGFTEFLAGLGDGGEVSFELEFDPSLAAHDDLVDYASADEIHNFYLKAPGWVSTGGGGYWAFAGLITKLGQSLPVKGAIMASVTIKVSGKPVWTRFTA